MNMEVLKLRMEQLRLQKQREQQEYYKQIAAQIEAKKLRKQKEVQQMNVVVESSQ